MNEQSFSISSLGDSVLLISFGNVMDPEINRKVLYLFSKLKALAFPFIRDVIPAYSSLAVYYDVFMLHDEVRNRTAFETINQKLEKILSEETRSQVINGRKIKIPVCYSEKFGLDLKEIAAEKSLSVDEVIQFHIGKKYRVYMIGFLPGFAYMGELDDKIATPRKQQPRTNVAAGSVGIAGKQTGIYPFDSPGGWQIIGQTPLQLFNKEKEDPVLLQPGDEIEFYSISEDEFANY